MSDLDKLKKCHDQLLLAEVVGWLHDYRKCSDEQLQVQSKNRAPNMNGLARGELEKKFPSILSVRLSLLNETEYVIIV